MATQSLLLSRDPGIVGVLCPMLNELGLDAEVCAAPAEAISLLGTRRFNPVIVDCSQRESGGYLLRTLRKSPETRDCIALGIVEQDAHLRDAFELGANLVLHKPLEAEETGRILRTARSLVTRMRRRFLRHVLHTLSYVRVDGVHDTPMLLDVSEGGLAIQALDPLEERRAFAIQFLLPDDPEPYEAVASAVWNDASGRAGLRFLGMPAAARERLRGWLSRRGADGPADVDPEDVPNWPEERVHFPVQLAPLMHFALSFIMDLMIVAAAVGLFGAISWVVTGEVAPGGAGITGGLLLGCVCWLLYRYVFFRSVSMTPGGHIVCAIADRVLAWMYNRKLAEAAVYE